MSIANVVSSVPPAYAGASESVAEPRAPSAGLDETRQAIADVQAKAAELAESKPDVEEIRAAAEKISEYISVVSRSLNIRIDRDLNEPIVTVLDADTEEVVRQIPSEQVVAIAKFLRAQEISQGSSEEALAGVLLSEEI